MKQYLLAVHMVEGQEPPSEDETQQAYKDVDEVVRTCEGAGLSRRVAVWVPHNTASGS